MKIDFLQEACRESTNEVAFGICDGPGTQTAYMTIDPSEKWVAIVQNEMGLHIDFHAIDGCVDIRRADGDEEKRCDVILVYADNIIFIELKEVDKNWISGGIQQLWEAIRLFSENHDLTSFRRKRAFLANRKQPFFKYSHKEEMERFRNATSVRLIIHNEIKI